MTPATPDRSSQESGDLSPGHLSAPGSETPDEEDKKGPLAEVVEWVAVAAIAILIAFIIKTWVLQAFSIPSESMEETLMIGDRVLVSKLDYRLSEPGPSQVVVFDNLDPQPGDPAQIIKRVVAVAGDTVDAVDGMLLVNGKPVDESYLLPGTTTNRLTPMTVPDGHVYVMGDNRANSKDSRVVGPVPLDSIVGRARLVAWPFSRITTL